ncbi:MAG: hypothetical protein ACYDCS_08950 [Candidatus Dormibacteria bacterium]
MRGSTDAVPAEGAYLRRAEALLAARAELFVAGSARRGGIAGAPEDRAVTLVRPASRQLTLPLPRERGRRRARMVG